MTIVNLDTYLDKALAFLKKDSGDEAICEIEHTADGPALRTKSWSGIKSIGMVDVYYSNADDVADFLGMDGEAYAWCEGYNGEPALAEFDSQNERDTWIKQK